MVEASFVPYNDETHRTQFYGLNIEYFTEANSLIHASYGFNLVPDVREYVDGVFPKFTAIKPPEGIICIMEVDDEAEGMGVLRKSEEGVGEIKRMYIRPRTRGNGLSKVLLSWLEEKAGEFGFKKLRLDTAEVAEAAVHLYRKAGYKETQGGYSSYEWEERSEVKSLALYMEKEL
jgi:GNAT superfamily N-acetyltransferase